MATNINLMVKVVDAKPVDVQKALDNAGIKVRSVIEVYKEEASDEKEVKK